jgi:hypothetical protein
MIATAETSLQLYTALLQALRYSMGFPWLSDQGEGFVSNGDKNNAMKAMSDLLKGETDIAYFGKKVAPNILSSQTPAMQQFAPLAQFQAERKQAAARNALNNLGMRGVGSRSLGEVIKDSDMQAVKGHLDLFMKSVSGDHQSSGSLLRTLTEYSGYDPVYTPEIFIDWNSGQSERKSLDHVRLAAELVRDGVVGKTPEIEEWLIGQLIQLAAGDA